MHVSRLGVLSRASQHLQGHPIFASGSRVGLTFYVVGLGQFQRWE